MYLHVYLCRWTAEDMEACIPKHQEGRLWEGPGGSRDEGDSCSTNAYNKNGFMCYFRD